MGTRVRTGWYQSDHEQGQSLTAVEADKTNSAAVREKKKHCKNARIAESKNPKMYQTTDKKGTKACILKFLLRTGFCFHCCFAVLVMI